MTEKIIVKLPVTGLWWTGAEHDIHVSRHKRDAKRFATEAEARKEHPQCRCEFIRVDE